MPVPTASVLGNGPAHGPLLAMPRLPAWFRPVSLFGERGPAPIRRICQAFSAFAARMLGLQGSGGRTALETAEAFDAIGASVDCASGPDAIGLTISALNEHLGPGPGRLHCRGRPFRPPLRTPRRSGFAASFLAGFLPSDGRIRRR